jgi:hypothetical protein
MLMQAKDNILKDLLESFYLDSENNLRKEGL